MPRRKVPADTEIHQHFWDLAQAGTLSVSEEVLAKQWGVTTRTVRMTMKRLIEQGRVVKPSHSGDILVVDPKKWGDFRAEAAARANVIDSLHEDLWKVARQSAESLDKVRVKNNHKLATWLGQKLLNQMVDEGRLYESGDYLVVTSPVSYMSSNIGVLPPRGSYLTLVVEPENTPLEEKYEPVLIEPKGTDP